MISTYFASVVVFFSASLLFVAELTIGKTMLPRFGGSAEVWAQSLFFFTVVVFLGYGCVYLLSRMQSLRALPVYKTILVTALVWSVGVLFLKPEYFFLGEVPLLMQLTVWYAPLIFLLATTSPVMQFWVAQTASYRGYSISNIGSAVGLCIFVFVLEPLFTMSAVRLMLAVLLVVFGLIYVRVLRTATMPALEHTEWPRGSRAMVVAYAAVPTYILVAATTYLSHLVAPIPLLWVVPLALYLWGIVRAFRGNTSLSAYEVMLVVLSVVLLMLTPPTWALTWVAALCVLALVGMGSVYGNAVAYAHRPPHASLPLFYVFFSLGGMLGTFLASIVSPLLFSDYLEIPVSIALMLVAVAAPHAIRVSTKYRVAALGALVVLFLGIVSWFVYSDALSAAPREGFTQYKARNFYGVTTVARHKGTTMLFHGRTLHGMQVNEADIEYTPHLYYGKSSGIGRAFSRLQRTSEELSVGVVGLGAGALGAYCRERDRFTFFEIDPAMESVARTYFSYLAHCTDSKVHIGDGRLLLAREAQQGSSQYDLLILDAFSDDVIPPHLLSREALALYKARVTDQGVIAFHISNRYVNLLPMLVSLAFDGKLAVTVVADMGDEASATVASVWVLMCPSAYIFNETEFSDIQLSLPSTRAQVWTDEYASTLPYIVLPSRVTTFFSRE